MTPQLSDSTLDLAILKTLDEDDLRMTEPQLATAIGAQAGGVTAVVLRCLSLHERGLIFSVDSRFWKISSSGRMALKKGEL